MFGYRKASKESKKLKNQVYADQQKKRADEAAEIEREKVNKQKSQEKAKESSEDRKKSYAEGRKRIQDLYNDPTIEGLSPQKRNALQYEADRQIQRSQQSANRKLLGDQSSRGVLGRGGVGFAQQKELQRLAHESQAQSIRDLDKLDSDLRDKHIAAVYAGEQGEAAQNQLDKQIALDELKLDDERKRQRAFEEKFNQIFSRL